MLKATYINLPVQNLARSLKFYTDLGFTNEPAYTDQKGGAIRLNHNTNLMLLTKPFFTTFTKQPVTDTAKNNETITTLELENVEAVDELGKKASAAGATNMETFHESNWMYGQRFHDPDGHILEILCMEQDKKPNTNQGGNKNDRT